MNKYRIKVSLGITLAEFTSAILLSSLRIFAERSEKMGKIDTKGEGYGRTGSYRNVFNQINDVTKIYY